MIQVIGTDLNGYHLDDAAIDFLEQTPMSQLDGSNILDAQGIRKITELTAIEHVRTNEFQRTEQKEITRQDVDARETILELERRQAEAEIKQRREVESLRAREEAATARVQEEERLGAQTAFIRTEEQLGIQRENQAREIAVAQKNRERVIAVESERIEKDRMLEVIGRERETELNRIAATKEVEAERREVADVIRERIAVDRTVAEQEESILTLRAVEDAERARRSVIIAAEAEAQEELGTSTPGGCGLHHRRPRSLRRRRGPTSPFEGAVRRPRRGVLYVCGWRDGVAGRARPDPPGGRHPARRARPRAAGRRDARPPPRQPGRAGARAPTPALAEPYVSDTYAAARPAGTGPLARTGNADLVRGISDCLALAHGVRDMTPTTAVYGRLAADCARAQDRYHWLADPELGSLAEPLGELRDTAQQVLAEFTAVQDLTRRAADALEETAERITALVRRVRGEAPGSASAWVERLTELRQAHGHLATISEMRYADAERIAELSVRTAEDIASAAQRAVSFLAREDAFDGYHEEIARLVADAGALETVRDASTVTDRLAVMTEGLATVTDVVAGLDIGDATVRTSILESRRCWAGRTGPAPRSTRAVASCCRRRGEPSSPPSSRCSGRR
ncbi:hypothetical protein SCALM49S_09791 [Streptomyces californicus]